MISKGIITEVLPKQGLVYSEKQSLSESLCKPKLIPIKSQTLQKMETIEKEAHQQSQSQASITVFPSIDNRQPIKSDRVVVPNKSDEFGYE